MACSCYCFPSLGIKELRIEIMKVIKSGGKWALKNKHGAITALFNSKQDAEAELSGIAELRRYTRKYLDDWIRLHSVIPQMYGYYYEE